MKHQQRSENPALSLFHRCFSSVYSLNFICYVIFFFSFFLLLFISSKVKHSIKMSQPYLWSISQYKKKWDHSYLVNKKILKQYTISLIYNKFSKTYGTVYLARLIKVPLLETWLELILDMLGGLLKKANRSELYSLDTSFIQLSLWPKIKAATSKLCAAASTYKSGR